MKENKTPDTIGGRLRLLRKENTQKLTLEDLARLLNYENRSSVSVLETNQTEARAGQIVALAKFYDVSSDYILGLSDVRKPINESAAARTGISEKNIDALAEDPEASAELDAFISSGLLDLIRAAEELKNETEFIKDLEERFRQFEKISGLKAPADILSYKQFEKDFAALPDPARIQAETIFKEYIDIAQKPPAAVILSLAADLIGARRLYKASRYELSEQFTRLIDKYIER